MKNILLVLSLHLVTCFHAPSPKSSPFTKKVRYSRQLSSAASSTGEGLTEGDRVLLIGPGFLQLNVAKYAKAAGLIPMIIAPQKKIESFSNYINDDEILANADIGLPDEKNTISGVVFCSEEAVFGAELVKTVLDWKDMYVETNNGLPKRVIACVPISETVSKMKSMGWMPIWNNDGKEKEIWNKFLTAFKSHPVASGEAGTIIRIGNLLGGSVDGIPELQQYGLDERIYKMSLENYRDLKERSFDRFRLGAQVIAGDAVNKKPTQQEEIEKKAFEKDEYLEMFRATGGYPEEDRTCRHTAAAAIVQALMRKSRSQEGEGQFKVIDENDKSVPKEFTVLSKCLSELPSDEDWDKLFQKPYPAEWPHPSSFDTSMFET